MTCPACGESLASARERCPACGVLLSGPVEGALAPLPAVVTPPARVKEGPGRELSGMRKRERTWQDEVKDRLRHRRQRKSGGAELPLFDDLPSAPPDPAAESVAPEPAVPEIPPSEAPLFSTTEGEFHDLPLRPPLEPELPEEPPAPRPNATTAGAAPVHEGEIGEDDIARGGEEEWIELPSRPPEPRPVERPALPQERLQAAAVDLALLTAIWTVVVYFASRAAHVPLGSLRPSWPWLLGYLAFLGLVYASYFTGTTGQTLGKMVTGLRVLHASGRPPGYLRAFLRAGAGALGILAVGLGQLPMMFDPARRALHDRLFGTRVVKR